MKKAKYAKEDETLQALLNMNGFKHIGDDKFRIETMRINKRSKQKERNMVLEG